jgi:hypothetical protein
MHVHVTASRLIVFERALGDTAERVVREGDEAMRLISNGR